VTGSWSETVDQADLASGAGSSLKSEYESTSSAFQVQVLGFGSDAKKPDSWRVDVRRSDTMWDSRLVLQVKRTSEGSGTGAVSGGAAYQTVTGTDQTFIQGSNDRANIRVQARVTGVSLSVPPSAYQTFIVLTVVDI
jgi:alpha-ketoglutarate-dependent taurine dioxygenase